MHWSEHLKEISLKIPQTDNSHIKRHFISHKAGRLIICHSTPEFKAQPQLLSFGRAEIEGGITSNGWNMLGRKVQQLQKAGLLE